MRRRWKIPFSSMHNVLNGVKVGYTLATTKNYLAGLVSEIDNGLSASDFVAEGDNQWVVNQYDVQQVSPAGEYAYFKCVFSYVPFDIGNIPVSGYTSETVSLGTNLEWASYSVSPYIYCNEKSHEDKVIGGDDPEGNDAMRAHIDAALTQPSETRMQSPYRYRLLGGGERELTDAEQQIFKKIAAGVNPVFHVPIVRMSYQYTTTVQGHVPSPQWDIDTITNSVPGVDVPGWTGKFIYTGRSFSTQTQAVYSGSTKVTLYTITYNDTWEGAPDPDEDFYGPNKWKFHFGPSGGWAQEGNGGGGN